MNVVPPLVPRKRVHEANEAAAAAPAQEAVATCKRLKMEPRDAVVVEEPPTLVVVPANHAINNVVIGQAADRQFFLFNGGGGQLDITGVALALNPNNEFAITVDNATNAHLTHNDPPVSVTIRFTPTLAPQRNATLQITSNDPADAQNAGRRDVAITGTGQFPAPVVEFLLPNGNVTNHVQVGLWDDAWNPADGALHNGEQENANFIGRDSRSFSLRVTDREAASRNAATVTIQWWTRRIDHNNHDVEEDDHHPATADLTLTHVNGTHTYVSKRVMLVTDAHDAAQGTHTGLAGGNVVAAGAADHRLRRVTVSARYGLDGIVRASYAHQAAPHASPVVANATVFNRNVDERRRIIVHLVKVLDRNGGQCTTTDGELDTYEAFIHSIYGRAGIFAQIDRVDLDPPAACTGWAHRINGGEDPAVVVAVQERSQNPIQIVPHPTQTALIQAANVQAGEIYLFFVANIYDPLTENHAGGEAFYAAQTAVPGVPANALAALNEQLRAQNLAEHLYAATQDAVTYTAGRRNRIDALLTAAREAATDAHEDNILLQARAFWTAVEQQRLANNPQWLSAAIGQFQVAARLNPYANPAYTQAMVAARGCAFIVAQDLLRNDVAPAHEMTHITTNLNNVADGHFDLEDPDVDRPEDLNGNETPGHIDGKNLMHRYALNGGAPAGVNIPKRLWNHQATNVHRNPNLVIPAQIASILANNTYIRDY